MKQIDEKSFEEETENGLVLIDFFATWCQPCKQLAPILEKLSEELEDVSFVKIDADQDQTLAQDLGIRGLPTLVLFVDGVEVDRISGMKSKAQLEEFLEEYR